MKKITSQMRHVIQKYDLISDGDKIAIGISGGKDSLCLLTALNEIKKYSPYKFEIVAITIDLTNGKTDWTPVKNYCEKLNVQYYVEKTNAFEIIFDIRKEKNPCSLCAKMRRGALNAKAKELGCNKVALAHHADDLVETFFLSLVYEGRLSTFMPSTYLTETKLTVIRPLIYTRENDITTIQKMFPVIKNICPVDKHTKRQEMKDLLANLEEKIPFSFDRIHSSIISEERYNLFNNAKK